MKFYLHPHVIRTLTITSPYDNQSYVKEHLLLQRDFYQLESLLQNYDKYLSTDMTYGTERLSFGMFLKDVFHLIKRITTRIYRLGRTIVENISKQYTLIAKLWENKLSKSLDKIDEYKFNDTTVNLIKYDTLKKRVSIISDIRQLFINIKNSINKDIDDVDPNDEKSYILPEYVKVYKQLKEIGFNITNKIFTSQVSLKYKSDTTKDTIQNHGYSISDLSDIFKIAHSIAEYTSKKFIKKLIEEFNTINNELVREEKDILNNHNLSEDRKQHEINKLQVKSSRLFYLSNMIDALKTLSEDQMRHILIIFRAAEAAIPFAQSQDDEAGPGEKYFL